MIAMSIAMLLGCDEDALGDMRRAALLHDVGKLAVSNRILDKPGRLTATEFAKVREHRAERVDQRWIEPVSAPPARHLPRRSRAARRMSSSTRSSQPSSAAMLIAITHVRSEWR